MLSDEEAKAAASVSDTTGKALDIVKDVGGFIAKYVGGPLEQGTGIFEDKLRYMRWERQQRLIRRAAELTQELGLPGPTKAVPLKLAIPLIQEASLEDDDALQDKWAALLVNAANINSKQEIKRAYINILCQLSPYDANVLDAIYSIELPPYEVEIWTRDLPDRILRERPPEGENIRPPKELELALATLEQLGLLVSQLMWQSSLSLACVGHTRLDEAFVAACRPERTASAS